MKPLPLKIDNYLLERIDEEARQKKMTKAEVVRSALIHYLINRKDLEDASLIRDRTLEPDIPEGIVKARLAHSLSETRQVLGNKKVLKKL